MAQAFSEIMFTPSVKSLQERFGSRESYRSFEGPEAPRRDRLGETEVDFIAARDSFYMASVSETGWPYVQHRGGPPGFLKVLDERTIGFADFRGNRQYVSTGNLLCDSRVSLILMDYPNRRRLKLLGRARILDLEAEPELIARLELPDYRARVERGFLIRIEALDWNCPQHITPRFTQAEVDATLMPLTRQLEDVTAERDRLRAGAGEGDVSVVLGDGPLDLVVTGIRQLTSRVRAYELRARDGSLLPDFAAGAHLSVPVRLPDGTVSIRAYSLSSDPARRDAYEIAVLRQDEGRGGSQAVHRDFGLGLGLRCGEPQNAFGLHNDDRPAVLVAGGIGITPLKSMAHQLVSSGRRVTLHYAVRSEVDRAFREELRALLGDKVRFYDGTCRLDVAALLAACPADAIVYVCGPERLTATVLETARRFSWSEEQVRFERFSARAPAPEDRAFDLLLAKSGARLRVAADETALEALERAGAAVASSCRAGICGTCTVKLRHGAPDHRDHVLTAAERAAGCFTPCVSRAGSSELVLDL